MTRQTIPDFSIELYLKAKASPNVMMSLLGCIPPPPPISFLPTHMCDFQVDMNFSQMISGPKINNWLTTSKQYVLVLSHSRRLLSSWKDLEIFQYYNWSLDSKNQFSRWKCQLWLGRSLWHHPFPKLHPSLDLPPSL